MGAIFVVLGVLVILLFAEYLSRYRGVHSELTRKLVHMLVGIFVAFWPFFLTWRQIQLLSLAFLFVVLISIKLNIFRSIHAVKRNAIGEVLFAMIIGILAFISNNEWVFMAAMLHLSLADGLAAIIGVLYGDTNKYKVLGETRSIAGNLAFFFSSVAIMLFYSIVGDNAYSGLTLIGIPVISTILENFAIKGTDNLVIPLFVALILTGSV